eukprot:c13146_g1_i1.p1 GENE.c13146_g1_i1~~c13146_g1_i1.p1  ORF type:complete len:142 (+),score=22.34 c13146_g1_i1:383-808(+)
MGLFMMEELMWGNKTSLKWRPEGVPFTVGPSTYKIPSFNDIPVDFRVSLLRGDRTLHNPTIYSSKGVGEPPLFLGSSIFFAAKQAVTAARADHSSNNDDNSSPVFFTLDAPASVERLRMACADEILEKVGQKGGERSKGCW